MRGGLLIQTQELLFVYEGLTELSVKLDGERPVTLRWLVPSSSRENLFRYLNGSSLVMEIDIRDSLKSSWKAQVNYQLDFEGRATPPASMPAES